MQFDLKSLLKDKTAILEIPIFLLVLLVTRAIPALCYGKRLGRKKAAIAGLMQATTLPFVIVAAQIGLASGQISQRTAASLLAAGLLSAAVFPTAAVKLLGTSNSSGRQPT